MKSIPLLIFSSFGIITGAPTILAQSTFQNVTVTSSIQVSNLPSSGTEGLDATSSQGEISGIIYYNNCNFASTLLGDLSYPNDTIADSIPLTSNLRANYSQWVKFDSLQVPDGGSIALSATSGSNGPSAEIPFSFTTSTDSSCNARVICTGSPLDYSLTLDGFQCFDGTDAAGTVAAFGLCAGLYLGSANTQLPCQPGFVCTYNNQFDSQCLPVS